MSVNSNISFGNLPLDSVKDQLNIESLTVPVEAGVIIRKPVGQTPPSGFVRLDGTSFTYEDYPELYPLLCAGEGASQPSVLEEVRLGYDSDGAIGIGKPWEQQYNINIKPDEPDEAWTTAWETWGNEAAWTTENAIPVGLKQYGVIATKNRVYVIGGRTSDDVAQTSVYTAPVLDNGSLGSWTTGPSLLTACFRFDTVVVKNKVYIIGGADIDVNSSIQAATIDVNGLLSAWTHSGPNPGIELDGCRAFLTKNHIYCVGSAELDPFSTFYSAKINENGEIGTWANVSNLFNAFTVTDPNDSLNTYQTNTVPTLLKDCIVFATKNKIFFIGGVKNNAERNRETYVANVLSDGTLEMAEGELFPVSISGSGVYVSNKIAIILDVNSSSIFLNYLVDGEGYLGNWLLSDGSLPSQKTTCKVITTKGHLYLFGGDNAASTEILSCPLAAFTNDYTTLYNGSVNTFTGNPIVSGTIITETVVEGDWVDHELSVALGAGKPWEYQYGINFNTNEDLGAWTLEPSLPFTISESHSVITNNRIYLLGGVIDDEPSADVYTATISWDSSFGPWELSTPLPESIKGIGAIVTKNHLHIVGGTTTYSSLIDSEGLLGPWISSAGLEAQLSYFQTFVTKTRVYLLGGEYGGTNSGTVFEAIVNADGTLGAWTLGTYLPYQSTYSNIIVTKNRVYLLGGLFQRRYIISALIDSEGVLGAWSGDNSLPMDIVFSKTHVTQTTAYLLGSLQSLSVYAAPILEDGTLGAWTLKTPLSSPSIMSETVCAGNKLYMIGGENGDVVYSVPLVYGGSNYSEFYDGSINVFNTHISNAGEVIGSTSETTTTVLPGISLGYDSNSSIGAGQPWVQQYDFSLTTPSSISNWSTPVSLATVTKVAGTLVTKDRIFIIGGTDAAGTCLNTVLTAPINTDGTLGTWASSGNLTAARKYFSLFVTKNRVHLLGGHTGTATTNTTMSAVINTDGTLGAWVNGATMSVSRQEASVVVTKNRVYMIGGWSDAGGDLLTSHYAFINADGSLGTWVAGPALSRSVYKGSTCVTKNRAYILGSIYSTYANSRIYSAIINEDGSMGAFTYVARLPKSLMSFKTVTTRDSIFIIGGEENQGGVFSNEVYKAKLKTDGTINSVDFMPLNQTARAWTGMTTFGSDVYACVSGGHIYKQTNGVGDFVAFGAAGINWQAMTSTSTDIYACAVTGDIYKQTNGVGNFVALSQTARRWYGMTSRGTDVYACEENGTIYKQTNGTGNFVSLGQTVRSWLGMASNGVDVYACVSNGNIYKQTNGTGNFVSLGQTVRPWIAMTVLGNDIYAAVLNGDLYKQTNGTGNFVSLAQTATTTETNIGWYGMTVLGDSIYATSAIGDIYKNTNPDNLMSTWEVVATKPEITGDAYVAVTKNKLHVFCRGTTYTGVLTASFTDGKNDYSQFYDGAVNGIDATGSVIGQNIAPNIASGQSILLTYDSYSAIGAGQPWAQQYDFNVSNNETVTNWTTPGNLPSVRSNNNVLVTENRAYLLGGKDVSTYVNTTLTATLDTDGTLGAWTSAGNLSGIRGDASVVVTKNLVHVLGGYESSVTSAGTMSAVINADGTLGTWVNGTNMSVARQNAVSVLTKNRVYLIGGSNTTSGELMTSSCASVNADGKLGTWTLGPSLPVTITHAAVCVTKNRVYLLGGRSAGVILNSIYTSVINNDGSLGSWVYAGKLFYGLMDAEAVVIKNSIYLIGGNLSSPSTRYTNSVYKTELKDDGTLRINTDFLPLGQVSRNWYGMTKLGKDIYVTANGNDIHKQTGGVGSFVALNQTLRNWAGMASFANDVYASVNQGDIYKQTNGVGDFIALGQTSRVWYCMTSSSTDVYAADFNGDIYKQTNGTGNFIALGQTSRNWRAMTSRGTDIYACVWTGDIYKQAGGIGDFIALGQTSRLWSAMSTLGTDIYACNFNGDIYKQTNGTGNFLPLNQVYKQWTALVNLDTDIYAAAFEEDIYKMSLPYKPVIYSPFLPLNQTFRNWLAMTALGSDIYATVEHGDIYKQTGGTGDFIALGQTSRDWTGILALGLDVYACVSQGDIYKQTGGTGNFIALGQTVRAWRDVVSLGSDVYAPVFGGDIYKQTNGTGNFVAMGQTSRNWIVMTSSTNSLYACVWGGDIYKQTNGVGNFIALNQTLRYWRSIISVGDDVYATEFNGDIYKQAGGVGNFNAIGETIRGWVAMALNSKDLYAADHRGDIYKVSLPYRAGGYTPFMPLSQTPRTWGAMASGSNDVYSAAVLGDIYKQTGKTGNFIALGQTSRTWSGMTVLGTDVYACVSNGDIYKQANGVGDFVALGQIARQWNGMTSIANDVYAIDNYGSGTGGDIYKQTNGTGNFVALGQISRRWNGVTSNATAIYVSVHDGDIYKATLPLSYTANGAILPLSQTSRGWRQMTSIGRDVYVCVAGGDIYKQTDSIGNFVALGQTPRDWNGLTSYGNNLYACVSNGDIYKQTNGTGNFVALGQTSRAYYSMATKGSDIYACVWGGDIFKRTNDTGNFIGLSQTLRLWSGMTSLGSDVYASVYSGDIYKQTGGTGDFIALGQTTRNWIALGVFGNDVYACVDAGDVYKQTNGTGNFIALGQPSRGWAGITSADTNIYYSVSNSDIYKQASSLGNFIALGQASRKWGAMATLYPDIYACDIDGDVYKQAGGAGDFISMNQTARQWYGMASQGSDIYASVHNGDIYKVTLSPSRKVHAPDFLPLGQTSRTWRSATTVGDDVYGASLGGDVYKQTNGVGNFVALGVLSRNWVGLAGYGEKLYACVDSADIYKRTNGTGEFVAIGQRPQVSWSGMTSMGMNIYACVWGGDIWVQSQGIGDFIAFGQTLREWTAMASFRRDVYVCVHYGDIYKQTNGEGNFIALGQTTRGWFRMAATDTDVYACEYNGDIYKQTGGVGDFVALGQVNRRWTAMTALRNEVYAFDLDGDVYKMSELQSFKEGWSIAGDLPVALGGNSVVVAKDKIHMLGGPASSTVYTGNFTGGVNDYSPYYDGGINDFSVGNSGPGTIISDGGETTEVITTNVVLDYDSFTAIGSGRPWEQQYDINTTQNTTLPGWTFVGNLLTACDQGTCLVTKGHVHILGGVISGSSYTNQTWSAPVDSMGNIGTWVGSGTLIQPTGLAKAVVTKDRVYLIGGRNMGGIVQTAAINIDGTLGAWSDSLSTIPLTLADDLDYVSVVVTKNKIYCFGGFYLASASSDILMAPIDSSGILGSWTNVGSLPNAVAAISVAVTKNRIYLIGGSNWEDPVNYIYTATVDIDGTVGPFTQSGLLPDGLGFSNVFVFKNRVYIIGGFNSAWSVPPIYSCPINSEGIIPSESWVSEGALPANVPNTSQSAVIGKYIYLFGGWLNGATANTSVRCEIAGGTVDYSLYYNGVINDFISDEIIEPVIVSNLTPDVTTVNTTNYNIYNAVGSGRPWAEQFDINLTQKNEMTVWVNSNALRFNSESAASLVTKNRVYLIGGHTEYVELVGFSSTNRIESAIVNEDGSLGTWEHYGYLPYALSCSKAIVTKNRVYLIGGEKDNNITVNNVLSAPIDSNGLIGTWTESYPLPMPLKYVQTVVTNSRVYVFGGLDLGGYDSTNFLQAIVNEDGSLEAWTEEIQEVTQCHSSAVMNNRVYVLGGMNFEGSWIGKVIYAAPIDENGTIGSWTLIDTIPHTVHGMQIYVSNQRLYLMCGSGQSQNSTASVSATLNSDGALNAWDVGYPELPLDATFAQVIVTKNNLHILGGRVFRNHYQEPLIVTNSVTTTLILGGLNDYSPYYDGTINKFADPDISNGTLITTIEVGSPPTTGECLLPDWRPYDDAKKPKMISYINTGQ